MYVVHFGVVAVAFAVAVAFMLMFAVALASSCACILREESGGWLLIMVRRSREAGWKRAATAADAAAAAAAAGRGAGSGVFDVGDAAVTREVKKQEEEVLFIVVRALAG